MGLNRSIPKSADPPRLVFGFGNIGVRDIHRGIDAVGDLMSR